MYCMDEFLYTLILLFSRKRKDTNYLTFSHNTQKPHKHNQNQGFETGLDRTVRSEKPQTIQLYGLFRVKNRFMPKKAGTRTNHGPTIRFCEPWPVFEVRTVSFYFSFSGEFWPIHRYEIMIRSRKNERARRRIKIGRRSDNFRSWTKGFVRKKKKTEEDKFLKKKKKGRRRTQRNRICAQLKQQPADCQHSRRSRLRRLLLLLLLSSFFFLLLFLFSIDGDHSIILFFTEYYCSQCCVLFLSCVTPFEFWIPRSLTWHALEWWKVLNF